MGNSRIEQSAKQVYQRSLGIIGILMLSVMLAACGDSTVSKKTDTEEEITDVLLDTVDGIKSPGSVNWISIENNHLIISVGISDETAADAAWAYSRDLADAVLDYPEYDACWSRVILEFFNGENAMGCYELDKAMIVTDQDGERRFDFPVDSWIPSNTTS